MDDRRFDSLVKGLAAGKSRRTVLKGLLGLGGAALTAGVVVDGDSEAARRPAPTPAPVNCPGQQVLVNGQCVCPDAAPNECGPACCTDIPGGPDLPSHSECCDNACCFGTCHGEELCCPTNFGGTREAPISPTHKICESSGNGAECCGFDQNCCEVDGCCDTACSEDGHCCAPEDLCPGDGESPNLCCVNNLSTSSVCCGAGTSENACFEAVVGVCCIDSDCSDSCQVCDLETHLCVARCDLEFETCCTDQAGAVQCVTGECCIDAEPGCEDSVCCLIEGRNTCFESCEPEGCATCEREADCCFVNDVFVGCIDMSREDACCTPADCEYLDELDDCLVGACINATCEQRSTCLDGQTCCSGDCVDGDSCASQCGNPEPCAEDEPCCPGFTCCNDSCRRGTNCPPPG